MRPDERRRFPRLTTELPVELLPDGNRAIPGRVVSLSRCGMELLCDHVTTLQVTPRGYLTTPSDNIHFDARLWLEPAPAGPVTLRCQVMDCRRLARDAYRIGLQFVALSAEQDTRLEGFLRQAVSLSG